MIKTKDEIEDMLNECRIQLEYINKIYPTGTGTSTLSRLKTFIEEYEGKEIKNDKSKNKY